MTARVADLAYMPLPRDVRLAGAGPDDLSAVAALDAIAFDGDIDVSRGMYRRGLLDVARVIMATLDGRIVGVAIGVPSEGTVAVFGVAVAPEAPFDAVKRPVPDGDMRALFESLEQIPDRNGYADFFAAP